MDLRREDPLMFLTRIPSAAAAAAAPAAAATSTAPHTKHLNIGKNHVPQWSVTHAICELLANAIDQDPQGFKYDHTPQRVVITNKGVLRDANWLMNSTAKDTSQNGGFGCGMKDALAPLHRAGVSYHCKSGGKVYALRADGEELVLDITDSPTPCDGRTEITLVVAGGFFPLPRGDQVMFTQPLNTECLTHKDLGFQVYVPRDRQGLGGNMVVWVRDVYKFEVPSAVGGFVVHVKNMTPKMREELGRDRRNASAIALQTIVKSVYELVRSHGHGIPSDCIPAQYRPPNPPKPKKKRNCAPPTLITARDVDRLHTQIDDLKFVVQELKLKLGIAQEAAGKLAIARDEAAAKSRREAQENASRALGQQRVLRSLVPRQVPTFSTDATKAAENDIRLRGWVDARVASDAFHKQVVAVSELFLQAFPEGFKSYGSAMQADAAMTDSDVDCAVYYPPTARNMMRVEDYLVKHVPLLKLTSAAKNVPTCPGAQMFHWTFCDLDGEVVVFGEKANFDKKMKERDDDPLSKPSPAEAEGVKFMKRLRMAAFGGSYPKSRVLTHVVREAHKLCPEVPPTQPLPYTKMVPVYLKTFLQLSKSNFDYYDRYTAGEWRMLKDIMLAVAKAFGLDLSAVYTSAPPGIEELEEPENSSWF